jgi:cell division initiation protein
MKITPLEIRQKTFEKNFRGYERDEVHAFLLTLSQEWERFQDENKELRIKLESAEREVSKLREVENSLYKTLKTAEDTGVNVIEQARKTAELHVREAQLKAEAMLNEAKSKAKDTIEESESRAKHVIVEMEDRLKALVDNYKKLDSTREDLLSDLKRMASDIMERVERASQSARDFDADKHLNAVRREAKKIIYPNYDSERPPKHENKPEEKKEPILEHNNSESDAASKKTKRSFFDEIG